MGYQRGVVHLSGQFGDTQLSIHGNRGLARFYTPPSKEKILTEDGYELTRQSMAEFTGASMATEALLDCLGPDSRSYCDRYFRVRAMARMRAVIKQGLGSAGQRNFHTALVPDQLLHLELDKKDLFANRLWAPSTFQVNPDRNTVTWHIPPFHAKRYLNPPQGATFFELELTLGILSDIHYVGGEPVYEAVFPRLCGLTASVYSPEIPCNTPSPIPATQLTCHLPDNPVLPTGTILILSTSITFYKQVNGEFLQFDQGRTKRIAAIY